MTLMTPQAITFCALILSAGTMAPLTMAAGPLDPTGAVQWEPNWTGRIESVNAANNSITVNDRVFVLQTSAVPYCRRSGRAGLRTGMTVNIMSTLGPDGVPIATQICID